eukprot:Sdes_comp19799_c0_seq2m11901
MRFHASKSRLLKNQIYQKVYLRNISAYPYRHWQPKQNLQTQSPWINTPFVEKRVVTRDSVVSAPQRRPNRIPSLRKNERPKTTLPTGVYPVDSDDPFPAPQKGEEIVSDERDEKDVERDEKEAKNESNEPKDEKKDEKNGENQSKNTNENQAEIKKE